MKLTIEVEPRWEEPEVVLRCREMTPELEGLAVQVRGEVRIPGTLKDRTVLLEPGEIFYCESVDKRTYLYGERQVFETPLRLYQLEERLAPAGFFRAAKALVVNLNRVRSLSPALGGRIQVTLENGELLGVSRQYVPALRRMLQL